MNKSVFLTFLLLFSFLFAHAEERSATPRNQLAPTPPMGWMTWNMFKGDISEQLIRETADAMVESGLAAAGYQYIFIDDLWQGGRDKHNNIIPDPKKFPNGMKAVADYVHSKGLKLGIYSDAAQLTCGGCTASYGFEEQDARTFASWGIDYLKYDYCNAPEDSATAIMPWRKPCNIQGVTSCWAYVNGGNDNARNGARRLVVNFGVPVMTCEIYGKLLTLVPEASSTSSISRLLWLPMLERDSGLIWICWWLV